MKSSLCLALSLSTFFSTSLSLPSHSHIRKGHASAMKEARAIKDNLMSPLVERSEVEDLTSLNKRSVRRFGTLDFGNTLQSRSNEDGEDDEEDEDDDDEDDDEEDDEDCDDESDSDSSSESDPNTSTTSPTSSNTAQNTSAQTYTVSSPKKVPSWKKNTTSTYTAPKKTEPTTSSNTAQNTSVPTYTVSSPKKVPSWKKETTSTYTATKKTKPTVDVSAGVSVSTGSGSSSSSSSTGISVGVTTYSGKATFFSQGGVAGACGTVHQDSDYVVAIDASMYEGGKFCGKTIAVTRVSTGKTIHCTGADECPECPSVQSLDLSIAAFNALGNPDEGVFDIKWEVVS